MSLEKKRRQAVRTPNSACSLPPFFYEINVQLNRRRLSRKMSEEIVRNQQHFLFS
jgi:hypothetical protein